MNRRQFAGAIMLMAMVSPAQAEIARIQTGRNTFGQGWLFLDQDARCKILTAAHVVARNGKPVPAMVHDRRGRQLETEAPEIFSTSPDIAVLPVRVPAGAENCSRSRLSQIGIDRRVLAMSDAYIETTGLSETQNVPVVRSASRIDSAGGEIFTVRLRGGEEIRQGWSGSIVRDRDGPLGVVVAVDAAKEATVVRVDVLGRLRRRTEAGGMPANRFTRIAVNAGETPDPGAGPGGILDARRLPWIVKPSNRRVSFVLSADRVQTFQRVVVEQVGHQPAAILSVEVEVGLRQGAGETFMALRSCAAPRPSWVLTCDFLEQSRSGVRISIVMATNEPVAIRRVALE